MGPCFPDSSVGKESACNAGDLGLIPGLGKIHSRRDRLPPPVFLGLPCGSAGKDSVCSAGDLGLILGLGRSPGEGKGYPLQYSGLKNSMDYTSSWGHKELDTTEQLKKKRKKKVAQTVKNPITMREIWVQTLGWENPLEKGMATNSSILAWRIPWTEEPGRLWSQRVAHNWGTNTFHTISGLFLLLLLLSRFSRVWFCVMP